MELIIQQHTVYVPMLLYNGGHIRNSKVILHTASLDKTLTEYN